MSCIIFRAWNNVSDIASTMTEVVIYEEPVIDQEATGLITNTSDKVINPFHSDRFSQIIQYNKID